MMCSPFSASLRKAGPPDPSTEATLPLASGEGSWSDLIGSARLNASRPRTSSRLSGKRVLITGAGGSIGSALALASLHSTPSSLILLDTSEGALYQTDRSLSHAGSRIHTPILGSVCDHRLLAHLFDQHRPQIVFHAAALKHVPLMEQNPFAAIETNALGTLTLAQAAVAHRAQQLILVSTDKAVDPHSIMGASKRLAELTLLTLASAAAVSRLTTVRLCNVLGSQGSVLPLFLDQIAHSRPLTVTHPDAQRYFITMDHAVRALFAALDAPSNPALLVPNPGPPLRILDLAHHLLQAHKSSAEIEFTGLRPGDKLSEQLLSSSERLIDNQARLIDNQNSRIDNQDPRTPNFTHAPPILDAIVTPMPALTTLDSVLSDLHEATRSRNLTQLLAAIHALIPEYHPSSVITSALTQNSATAPELHA